MVDLSDHTQLKQISDAANSVLAHTTVYQDAIQPVAKEIGKSLQTVGGLVNLALEPVRGMVYGYDLIKARLNRRLEDKLRGTKKENIIQPPLNVVGPLVQQYRYVESDKELSDMFVNLLANAMDKEHVKKAHPSFVNIISALSPDEAKLIKFMRSETILPKIDINVQLVGKPGTVLLYANFTIFGEKSHLAYPDLTPSYIGNLIRLGLIDIPPLEAYTDNSLYEPLKLHPFVKNFEVQLSKQNMTIVLNEGSIRITDFGRMFMDAVLEKQATTNTD